jgi:hypothetical protein
MITVKILLRLIWWVICDCVRGFMRNQEFLSSLTESPFYRSDMFRRWKDEDIIRKTQRDEWLASQDPENYEPDIKIKVY